MTIFASIGAAIFGSGTFLAGLTAYALQAAAGIALSAIAQSLAGSDNKTKETENKVRLSLASGEDVSRSFACGLSATAGSLVYFNDWGNAGQTKNAYHTRVIALYDLPTNGLVAVWFKGVLATLLTGSPHSDFGFPVEEYRDDDGADHVWVKFYDGTQTTADSFLVNRVSTTERPYASTRVGHGIAYVILTFLDHDELLKGQMPEDTRFVVNGTKFYDPSKDSSVGGAGSQRKNNPATWGGDGDHLPAVQIYNIMNGIRYNDAWFYGLQQVSAGQFPMAPWIAEINKCRALIQGPDGMEPTYRTGGEVRVSVQVNDTISDLLTGCQGRISETGGIYKMFLGVSGAAVVSITDGHISDRDAQSFTPFFGLSDTVNGITAKYPAQESGFVVKIAPPLYRTDLEEKAGNRRLLADVSLDFVPYSGQVQRLMKSALLEAQRARRHTFVLDSDFWILEPGDIVEWTSERNGYETKLFRVDGVGDRSNLDILVDFTEVDPEDYDWDQDTDYRTPTDGVLPIVRLEPLQLVAFEAVPDYVEGADGAPRRPTIRVSCAGGMPAIEKIWIQARLKATGQVVYNEDSIRYAAPFAWRLPAGPFLPDSLYEVRGRYVAKNGVPTAWEDWIDVLTPDIRLGRLDVYDIDLVAMSDDVKGMYKWLFDDARALREEAEALALRGAEQDLGNFNEMRQIRREVSIGLGNVTAGYLEAITVAVGPGSAIVSRLELLEVKIDEDIADAFELLQAQIAVIDGEVSANSDAIIGTNVTIDGISASTAFRASSSYSVPGGYAARIGLEGRVGSSGSYRTAAIFIDVPGSPSSPTRVVLDAEQLVFGDFSSGSVINPLIYSGGVWRMNVANIGTVTAGLLKSADNKMQIDLNNKFILIET